MKEPWEDKLADEALDREYPVEKRVTVRIIDKRIHELFPYKILNELDREFIKQNEGNVFEAFPHCPDAYTLLPDRVKIGKDDVEIIEEDEEDSANAGYCPECGACGEDGCCPALMCAYNNMVVNGHGKYCEGYYWDLVVAYEALSRLTEKHLDEIDYKGILDKVWKDREAHNRKIEPWMELTKREIIDLDEENWKSYKEGRCLCSAHSDNECVCGAWRQK